MILSVEGNIGSGKSTFCKYLKDHFSRYYNRPNNATIYFVDEPVDTWLSIADQDGNLLDHFYKCPEKYSYCFQMTAYISRLIELKNVLKKSKPGDVIIMERSVFSDYNVFAKMLHDSGKINEIEYKSYNMWFDNFLEELPGILFVYLKTDADKCYERVLKRSRKEETNINLEYLSRCESYHEKWLNVEPNILTFDGNAEPDAHPNYLDIIKQMINFKTNHTKNCENDSDDEHYREYHYDRNKWNKRLYNKTLEECRKRIRTE
jgi:deoxyadenosine/deoxycytidine kinase